MKLSVACVFSLLLVASVAAFADSIQDPKIIIRGVSGGSAPTLLNGCPAQGCTHVGTTFTFGVPDSGKGTLYFTNASGQNWTSLALFETGVAASDISCIQNLFLSCSVKTLASGAVEILLSGIKGTTNPMTGILNGQSFSINFGCVNGSCWPGGLDFTARANATVPEPATVALMLTGLGAIVTRRRKWNNRVSS